MKQVAFSILVSILSTTSVFGQYISPQVLEPQDTIIVDLDIDKGLSYSHIVKPKQTMYAISKYFNLDINSLYTENGLTSSDMISPGQELIIPIDLNKIDTKNKIGVPVVYQVRPKETLYRISKIYFDQEVSELVERNQLSGFNLDVGKKLVVGFLNTKNQNESSFTSAELENDSIMHIGAIPEFSEVADTNQLIKKRYSEKSVAIWDKNASDQQSSYVLHKSAKPGTYIEIFNPVVRRKTMAQVVGNLPVGLYPIDVDMVMSPLVAKSLGALDTRIMVELTYQY
jgi:LysM repeat protein